MLTFNLAKRVGEDKKAMEVKRVIKLRTVGHRDYSVRMWPHPIAVLKATQKGLQPHVIVIETSTWDEPDRHPDEFIAFKRNYPLDGAADGWRVPTMEVAPCQPQPAPKPVASTMVAVAMPQPKTAPPPQPRPRERELERPAKKQRSWLDVVNNQLANK